MIKTLLIVDDKIKLCDALAQAFQQQGYHTVIATNREDAITACASHPIHVALLDIKLGAQNGVEVLGELLQLHKHLPVIMMTGHASVETAVQSLKLGAFDYVKKPLDFHQLANLVENAIRLSALSEENQQLKDQLIDELSPRLITQTPKMLEVAEKAKKLAVTDLPVLIFGENGTGKEVIADFLHINSPRNSRKMLKINCAAFPESLLDNELFGHEKGAYTGADAQFKGVFERADQSSLFLDEIGDMPLTIQAKILRALQNREIRRLGGSQMIHIHVRFIAATNKDLQKLIEKERFREDLYYRLKAAVIKIPPLRDRKDDLPLLAHHFLTEFARATSTPVKTLSDAVRREFSRYDWPGNVREFKNVVAYAVAIASGDTIQLDDLPPDFLEFPEEIVPDNMIDEVEKNLIIKMLQKTDYNKKRTAELLNIGRKTLYRKLEKYGITVPE